MPTVEEVENAWEIPQGPKIPENETEEQMDARKTSPEQRLYDRKLAILVWWLDDFLPHAVGLEFWGPDIRCFHKLVDKALIEGDPSGKPKVYVTVTSEAFAHVLYANCRDNWMAQAQFVQDRKKKGGKKPKAPTYKLDDPTTHKYRNKWSNGQTGQVMGGGWDEGAFEYLKKMQKKLQTFRVEQASKGDEVFKFALTLMKITHDIELDQNKEPANAKKRKGSSQSEMPAAKKQPEIIYIDE